MSTARSDTKYVLSGVSHVGSVEGGKIFKAVIFSPKNAIYQGVGKDIVRTLVRKTKKEAVECLHDEVARCNRTKAVKMPTLLRPAIAT